MPVESDDDRAAFFNVDEFGVAAVYTPIGADASPPIAGQFDNPATTMEIGERAPVVDRRPTFTCRSDDLPPEAEGGDAGDLLTIEGDSYRVLDILDDGAGLTRLTLGAAS